MRAATSPGTLFGRLLVSFVLYFASIELGLLYRGGGASPLWPPAGLGVAAVLLWGPWMGLAVAGATLVSSLSDQNPLAFAIAISAGATFEASITAAAVRWYAVSPTPMRHWRDVGALGAGGLAGSVVAATVGALALMQYGLAPGVPYATLWRDWWAGDIVGILVITPSLLEWAQGSHRVRDRRFWAEAALLCAVAVAVAVLALWPGRLTRAPLAYTVFPPLTWAAWRFGAQGATAVSMGFSGAILWGTANGLGPFAGQAPAETVLLLQLFLLVISLTSVMLALSVQETQTALARARESRHESETRLAQLKETLEALTVARAHEHQALLQSDALKTALLSSVSHELRTPLTSVRTTISSVLEGHLPPAVTREILQDALDDMDYLARLVSNLLDMSRIEAGTLVPDRQWHTVEEIVETSVRRVGLPLEDPRFTITLEPDLPPVLVDGLQVQLVLVNLLDNAVKYSSPTAAIHLSVGIEGDGLVTRVGNEGTPPSPAEAARLFERFYRADRATTPPVRGLGLGLAIAKGAVESHGGAIWVDGSQPGVTTFAFSLPVGDESAWAARPGGHASGTTSRTAHQVVGRQG